MWRFLVIAAGLVLATGPGRAENLVVVTGVDCGTIVAHVADPDVAYRPGVDVAGRAVAPADLPDPYAPRIPDRIGIDLTIPLAMFLGPATPDRLGDSDIVIGQVVVDRPTGEVSYNGRPLADPARHAIATECARRQRAHRERR